MVIFPLKITPLGCEKFVSLEIFSSLVSHDDDHISPKLVSLDTQKFVKSCFKLQSRGRMRMHTYIPILAPKLTFDSPTASWFIFG